MGTETSIQLDLFDGDGRRPLAAHIWQRESLGYYIEEPWCPRRLFDVETFVGSIHDPACGRGVTADWLADTPLARVYLLTPRPSMPPGQVIEAGEKPEGGKQDFVWLVWRRGYVGPPELRWLHRDGAP